MHSVSQFISALALVAGVSAVPVADPATPNFALRGSGNETTLQNLRRAEAVNYNQNYIASGAGVTYTPNQGAGSFSVSYNTNADFVVGLGWQPGNSDPITYSGSFSASGVGLLSVYGWSTNPLVEYYVIEDPIGYPQQGTQKGTFTTDGSTYSVWLHQQVNQPSISGTTTFNQYISIRQSPRTSGTVTIANHFAEWKALGLNLGTLNYQVVAVESWSGSGKGSITVSKGAAAAAPAPVAPAPVTPAPTTAPAPVAPVPVSGTADKYGQCGGIGWTGATACAAGSTCQAANSYYSQCL